MHSFVFSYQLSAMIKITEHSSVLNFYLDRIVLRSRPRLLKMHLLYSNGFTSTRAVST